MAGPWEKYQQPAAQPAPVAAGPWNKYSAAPAEEIKSLPDEVVRASDQAAALAPADRLIAIQDALGSSPAGLVAALGNYARTAIDAHTAPDSKVRGIVDSAADNAIGAPVAMMHHAGNIPVALAQLGAHGIAGDGGAAASAVDDFARKREETYQNGMPTNLGTIAGATVGEVLPWVMGLGELRAAGAISQATSTLGKLGTLGVEGGAMGALQPVTGDGSFAGQKALQIGSGATAGPALYGLGQLGAGAVSGVRDVAQHITNPQAIADKHILSMFGSTPDALTTLRAAPQYVPGEVPSAAQVLATPEAVKAERLLRNNPNASVPFAEADNANNEARQAIVSRLAGTPEEMAAAIANRKANAAPFIESSLTPDNLIDPSGVLQTIAAIRSGPLGVNPKVAEGLDFLTKQIGSTQDSNGKVGADVLDAVRQQASRLLGNAKVPGSAVGTQQGVALGPVKNQIVDAIERVAPGYRDYVAGYRKDSLPINTMQSVGRLVDPNAPGSLNAAGDPQLAISRLRQVLRGDDKARFPMSDDARGQLDQVRQSLLRRTISNNPIAASGPATAADLQAANGTALGSMVFGSPLSGKPGLATRAVGTMAGGSLGALLGGGAPGAILGSGLGSLLPEAAAKVNAGIATRIGATAADSNATADAILRALRAQKRPSKMSSELQRLMFGTQQPPPLLLGNP